MTTPTPAFAMPPVAPSAVAVVTPPPAPQPGPAPLAPLDVLVDKYRQIRDKKKALDDARKAEIAPYSDALDQLEAMILDALNKAGVESVGTSAGTAFKTTRTSYTVKDPVAFREWIEQHGRNDLLETRISKEAIEDLIASGATLPPGIKISSEVKVNVRK